MVSDPSGFIRGAKWAQKGGILGFYRNLTFAIELFSANDTNTLYSRVSS